jgi:hypothetical protein
MNTLRKWYRHRTAEKVVFTVVGFVVIGLLSGWGVWSYVDSQKTYPLGDELEYIGRREYGCITFCSAAPNTMYTYATNLSPEEVVHYFKNAELIYPISTKSDYRDIILKNDLYPNSATLYFYDNSTHPYDQKHIVQKYYFETNAKNYTLLKDSL